MSGNFDGIKRRNFGIEIEMTGLTRCQAAKAAAKTLGGQVSHNGGFYDKYSVSDSKGRSWSFVSDSSIICKNRNGEAASRAYSVELNSPVLEYEDIPLLQEVIRALRRAGGITGPAYKCGTHIHISADDYTPRQLRNLVNIFSSKEDYLWDALQVSSAREWYCKKIDRGPALQCTNIYPLMYVKGFYDGLKSEGETEVLSLVRCAWAGSQKYGALTWSGDIHSSCSFRLDLICRLPEYLGGPPI